jgi:nitrous oxidase accessory protein NosD
MKMYKTSKKNITKNRIHIKRKKTRKMKMKQRGLGIDITNFDAAKVHPASFSS